MTIDEHIKRLRNEGDNYDQTVQAIKALAHELLFDDTARKVIPGGRKSVGRRLDTTSKNRVSPNAQVTPDLVVVISDDSGVVAEAKLALSRNPAFREAKLIDVQKYDDDLGGWDTPSKRVTSHDLVLIVHYFHAANVKQQMEALRKAKKVRFDREFAIVSFALVDQAEVWLTLGLIDGRLSDTGKTEKLAATVPISMEYIAGHEGLAHVKLYDAKPPLPFLMNLIHEELLGTLEREQYLDLLEKGEVRVPLDVAKLREHLADALGPGQAGERVPEIPRADWVCEALDAFVDLGWAEGPSGDADQYAYHLKKRRKTLDQFCRLCATQQVAAGKKKARAEEAAREELEKYPLFERLGTQPPGKTSGES